MASVVKSSSNKRDPRPRASSDKKPARGCEDFSSSCVGEQDQSSTLNGDDIQSLIITAHDLEKLRVPKPPKDSQKPKSMSRVYVRKTRPPDEVGRKVRVTVARPLPHDAAPQPLAYAGPGGPRFDAQGMVLPHSILGSLEDFKREMELRGDTELLQRIPEQQKLTPLLLESERNTGKATVHSQNGRDQQSHALQHWYRHMSERRRQQDFISRLLQKPVGDLLMNQSSRFRQMQEERDLINRGLCAIHAQHGRHVGSEFWNIPQHYGDELSGITATLNETEKGNPPPITRIGHPHRTRLESGNVLSDAVISGWDQSVYLQQRRLELKDILRDISFSPPDIDGLEVLGSGLPFTSTSVRSSSPPDEEDEGAEKIDREQKENEDPLALFDDVIGDVELVPALRFCGELARWTGKTSSCQEQQGLSVRLMFEAVTGESVSADLELKNEGSTAIYYSWTKMTQHTHTQHFYFNSTAAVILPGSTTHITVIFKSVCAGIRTEVWRLNTHPVLMGGASVCVTLRGVALDRDRSAQQRAALERQLQHREAEVLCGLIVQQLVRGVCTPDRPSSPDELHITEEERFNTLNPDVQYQREPVEALQRLWQQINGSGRADGGHTPVWDLSLNTLTQVLLCLPETDEQTDSLSRETCLSQYNSLLLQLQQPAIHSTPLTLHNISLQLWRELLDGLVSESVRLRHTLGLPENNIWSDTTQDHNTLEQMKKEEKRGGATTAVMERAGQERGKVLINVPEERIDTQDHYRRLLHTQVSVLMNRMIDSLCDLLDAQQSQLDPQKTSQ